MRFRRRGVGQVAILASLPIVLVVAGVSYQISARILRFEGHLQRQIAEETTAMDLVRRMQRDVRASASAAWAPSGEDASKLTLSGVDYHITTQQVVRIDRREDSPASSFSWKFQQLRLGTAFEPIGRSGNGIVWITMSSPSTVDRGPAIERTCTMAARVGAEGRR